MRRPAVIVVSLALIGLAVAAGSAVASPRPDGESPADRHHREHRRIVDFWTTDRVRQAVPRDFVATPGGRFLLNPRAAGDRRQPAAGTVSSGSATATATRAVLGASWTNGGAVLRTTGKVLFQMGQTYYVCSAGVVTDPASDRSIVLTAGHCVYDQATQRFASNWLFVPDYDSAPAPLTTTQSFCARTRYGCWTASALVAHQGFTSQQAFNADAARYDWGFAVLGGGGKATTPQLVEAVVGAQPFRTGVQSTGVTVHAFGYPALTPYNGKDLTYCRGPLGTDPGNGGQTWGVGCRMTGGSSGGPWFTGLDPATGRGTQMSVNSYGYQGVNTMFGPKFDEQTQATYQLALTTVGNAVAGNAAAS